MIVVIVKECCMKKQKEIKKALTSDKPINAMYSMIPKKDINRFLSFAKKFGYTKEKIKNILANEL